MRRDTRERRHARLQPCDWRPPIRFLGGLERAHRGEQERKRQAKLDNCAQNSDNDGVEITGTHDLLLLKKRPLCNKVRCVAGPFCFFRLTRDVPTTAASKKSAMANLSVDAHSRTHCFVLPHLTSDQSFIRLKLSADATPSARSFIRLKLSSNAHLQPGVSSG